MGAAQPLTVIRERYRLDALIGEGGMASVWRAWDLTLQRPVAVKLLFARESHTEEVLVDRFLREARIAASVQHRNVIHIVDFGTTDEGQPFMVMELLEGETLAARLRRQKPLPVADVLQIGHLTLRGLGAVHAAGIIHRDLKPENVYLKNENGVVYPKILDFGISRSIDPPHGPRSALTTREGVIVGTPEYMSPEQARGVKQLDYRTDIYSMGVVLYESLTGRLPYISENVGDLIIKIVTGSPTPVHELLPSIPRSVSEVVSRAMSRLPGDRFLDAAEMQEALLAASRSTLQAPLPALSNLPPEAAGGRAVSLPYPPRSGRALPRTQAMRMLVNPPPAANEQKLPGFMAAPTVPPSAAAAAVTVPPRTPPSFGIIEASPRQVFDPGEETDYDASGNPVSDPAMLAPAFTIPDLTDAGVTAPPATANNGEESPLSTRPTDRAPGATLKRWIPLWLDPWLKDRRKRLYLAAAGGGAVLVLGLTLWLAGGSDPAAPAASSQRIQTAPASTAAKASTAEHKPSQLADDDLGLMVTLQLQSVPEGARVTVDGVPSSSVIELPRGDRQYEVAIAAPGMHTWHMTYVPQEDSSVEVTLLPAAEVSEAAPEGAEPAQPAARPKRSSATSKWRSKIRALRIPDF